MMSKADHIAYWMVEASDNWVEAQALLRTSQYIWALFVAHLTIEKLSKALWVKENEADTPPRTHKISSLLDATSFVLTPDQAKLVTRLNTFQLEGRYSDYHRTLRAQATAAYTAAALTEVAALRQCLLSKLP